MARTILKKKIYQYTAVFEPDQESGGYTVSIPNLPGCISEGETFEEAFKNIQEATGLYLDVMKEEKKNIPLYDQGVIIAPIRVAA
ncbi:MAG: type II toxin-antitoxin system HicB family antitoxin [Candidatus Magasanikbacteria bacterium]|nr:type II toxin-antitoxin system HicB family antitoxin [Candidatus Magasanikbacteria bacterium]